MAEHTDNQQPSLDLRTCRKCGETKPLSEFARVYSKKTRGKEYRQHTCLGCHRVQHAARARRLRASKVEVYRDSMRRHRNANRERYKAQRRARYRRLRDQVYQAYGGYRCACCGVTEPSMLTLDHVNNDGKAHRESMNGLKWAGRMLEWIIANGYPPTFQVLCWNCNQSKRFSGGVCAHQIKEGSTTIPIEGVGPSGPKRTAPDDFQG